MASVYGQRDRFHEVITDAINDIAEHGYDSQERVDGWLERIRRAAEASLVPLAVLEEKLKGTLGAIYRRLVERGGIARYHPGVPAFTIQRVRPHLRRELDRRIAASAGLIRMNRAESVGRTLRRFAGWSTSVPPGGSEAVDRREEKAGLRKALARLPWEERRVVIDQGHKLVASLNDIIATDGGAIAAEWHSHYDEVNYDYRPDHKARDSGVRAKAGKPAVYAIKGSWADREGLVTKGAGWLSDMTQPGEEPFCRCYVTYIYSPRRVPRDMLTKKGERYLAEAAARVAA